MRRALTAARRLCALSLGLACAGCGFTGRVGLAPTVDTRGDVRLDLVFGLSATAGEPGAAELSATLLPPLLAASPETRLGDSWGAGGLLVADRGPNGRLGASFERRALTLPEGQETRLLGIGVGAAVLLPFHEKTNRRPFFLWTYRRYVGLHVGAGLQLRWLWGAGRGRGELALPLLFEAWHL